MKLIKLGILLTALLINLTVYAQTDSVYMTQIVPYGGVGLVQKDIMIPDKFKALFGNQRTLNIPQNWQVSVFHIGNLTKPRVLEINKAGVLHVIDYKSNGSIYALPDANKDNIADTLLPVVSGVNAHDFKFYGNKIFVAEETKIWVCSDLNQDGFFETKTVLIDSIGLRSNNPSGGHRSRTIVVDSLRQKIYVSIGSSCNVCRDQNRANIEQYNIDGTQRKVFATGVRNAVGMAIDPYTGKLWANNNGSDQQGNDIPPEWLDEISENGFYGFPFAYGNKNWFNMNAHPDYVKLKPITATDSFWVSKMVQPKALIQAHSAPMEMEFMRTDFSMLDDVGVMMALRGSWNRSPATGYKLVYFPRFGNPQTSVVSDFATGFLTDSISGTYWARPVGLASNIEGPNHQTVLYMSSDAGKTFILKFTLNTPLSLEERKIIDIPIHPNPFIDKIHINKSNLPITKIEMYDAMGKKIELATDPSFQSILVPQIPNGMYLLMIYTENQILVKKVIRNNID